MSSTALTPPVLAAFGLDPAACLEVVHGGHINDTYLAAGKYIIQRINRFVFPRPDHIMENMVGVTRYLRQRVLEKAATRTARSFKLSPRSRARPFLWTLVATIGAAPGTLPEPCLSRPRTARICWKRRAGPLGRSRPC